MSANSPVSPLEKLAAEYPVATGHINTFSSSLAVRNGESPLLSFNPPKGLLSVESSPSPSAPVTPARALDAAVTPAFGEVTPLHVDAVDGDGVKFEPDCGYHFDFEEDDHIHPTDMPDQVVEHHLDWLLVHDRWRDDGPSPADAFAQESIVEQPQVQTIMALIIALNALTLGLEVDLGTQYPKAFEVLENVFALLFCFELALRMMSQAYWYDYFFVQPLRFMGHIRSFREFLSIWSWPNVLDFLLVLMAVFEVWVIRIFAASNLRMLSVLRLLRLVRLVRVFAMFDELSLIISGLVKSTATLAWVSVILIFFSFPIAVLLVTLIGKGCRVEASPWSDDWLTPIDNCEHYYWNEEVSPHAVRLRYYGSLWRCFYTLFSLLTLDEWDAIIRPIVDPRPWIFLMFFLYFTVVSFCIMNIVVAVICEQTFEAANNQGKDDFKQKVKAAAGTFKEIAHYFVGTAGSDVELPLNEFAVFLSDDGKAPFLMDFIQHSCKISDIEISELLDLADADKDGKISVYEFLNFLGRLTRCSRPGRGEIFGTYARVLDIVREVGGMRDGVAELRRVATETNPTLPHRGVQECGTTVQACLAALAQRSPGCLERVASKHVGPISGPIFGSPRDV